MIVISIIGWYVIDHDAKVSIRFDCGSMLVLISNSRLRRLTLNSVTQTAFSSLITYARNFRFQFEIATLYNFWYVRIDSFDMIRNVSPVQRKVFFYLTEPTLLYDWENSMHDMVTHTKYSQNISNQNKGSGNKVIINRLLNIRSPTCLIGRVYILGGNLTDEKTSHDSKNQTEL